MLNDTLKKHNFRFNKKYGQNFITDKNLLQAIVADSGINSDSTVLEIGAGAGTLTRVISHNAKKVISIEIDHSLQPVLSETLEGCPNVEVVFGDFLKFSEAQLARWFGTDKIDVVANLPYYITTPILFRLLECGLNIGSITVMLQKEVAQRLTAAAGTKEYGVITAVIDYTCDTKITRIVGRNMFYPVPEVDSAVIKLTKNPAKPKAKSDEVYYRLVKAAFAMRRKTLANNLIAAFPLTRVQAEERLEALGKQKTVRGEQLTVGDFIRLADMLT